MFRYHQDNRIFQLLGQYADLLLLSALWLLTSLPLLTAGASTAALYRVLLKLASGRDETSVVRAFFVQWRTEWRRATLVWLCLLGFWALVCADFAVCLIGRPAGLWGRLLWTVSFIALLTALIFGVYVFAVNAQFQCTLQQTFSNALRLAAGNPARTLLLLILLAVSVIAVAALGFFSISVLGVLFYQSARILYKIFTPAIEKHMGPQGQGPEGLQHEAKP